MTTPDGITPLTAYRGLRLRMRQQEDRMQTLLTSCYRMQAWPRGMALRATCTPTVFPQPGAQRERHPAPHEGCGCGIYATSAIPPGRTQEYYWPITAVVARIEVWGKIIEHEPMAGMGEGFVVYRAEWARVTGLVSEDNGLRQAWLETAAREYGVPILEA